MMSAGTRGRPAPVPARGAGPHRTEPSHGRVRADAARGCCPVRHRHRDPGTPAPGSVQSTEGQQLRFSDPLFIFSTCPGAHRSLCPQPVQPARPFLSLVGSGATGYREQHILGYLVKQMYELVANVGDYRLFVPWCRRSAVLSHCGHVLRAELEVGFPPLHERYLSEVSLGPRQIRAVSSDCRLFRHLETLWRFGPGLPGRTDSCSLDFSVSFVFRSALHSRLAGLFLDEVAKQMVAAFEGRARELFGPQAAARPAQ
ncbi:coenzyme Q-binding protein COQ10 homolog B, mitochondrial-like [Mergus octosetaceus]